MHQNQRDLQQRLNILNITETGTRKHHQHSADKTARQEQLKTVAPANPFSTVEGDNGSQFKLVNFMTKQIMLTKIHQNVLNMNTCRNKALISLNFVEERISSLETKHAE